MSNLSNIKMDTSNMQNLQLSEQALIDRIEKKTLFAEMLEDFKGLPLNSSQKESEDKCVLELEAFYEKCRNQLEIIYKNKIAYFKDIEKQNNYQPQINTLNIIQEHNQLLQ